MDNVIRPWVPADATDLAHAVNNKNILDNLRDGLPFPYTVKDAGEYIRAMLAADKNETFAFAIVKADRAVGSIGAFRQGNIHRLTAEIGYYVAEEYWGQGFCTRAVKEICRTVFECTDIVRLFAEPFAHNKASCRVLEKAGFTREGTLRRNAVKNGQLVDMNLYAILK